MIIKPLSVTGIFTIEPEVFYDQRGFFFESYNQTFFNENIAKVTFVQDNHSRSNKGVFRGMHYQMPPKAQGKLVRVIYGEILDVALDIRRSSPSFGQYVCEKLSAKNNKQMWIPEGFAHGFLTLSDEAEVLYKTTDFYSPSHERSIHIKSLDIKWPFDSEFIISEKDALGFDFEDASYFD